MHLFVDFGNFVGFFSAHQELKRKDSRSFFSHTTRTSPPVDQKVKALQLCDPWHPHVFHVKNPTTSPRDGWTSNICDVYVDVYPNLKRFPPKSSSYLTTLVFTPFWEFIHLKGTTRNHQQSTRPQTVSCLFSPPRGLASSRPSPSMRAGE